MPYTPDIFSTQGGLTITAVGAWIQANDTDTLERWLTSGNDHPRMAAQAIGLAVEHNRPAMAERIWQAGWHKPGAAFKEAWLGWRSALASHKHTRLPDAGKHRETWQWLLDKHIGATDKRTATLHNDSLLEGLMLALHFDAPARWKDIMDRGLDLNAPMASRVFHYALYYTPWLPQQHEPPILPWVIEDAIPQLLDNGFKPGGTTWVKSLEHQSAAPLFECLMERCKTITTPRMRAAILVSADTTIEPIAGRWSTLTQRFFDLGVPETIVMNNKEAALPSAQSRMDAALENAGWGGIDSQIDPRVEKQFNGPSLSVMKAVTNKTQKQFQALFRSMALNQGLPPSGPKAPKPRF